MDDRKDDFPHNIAAHDNRRVDHLTKEVMELDNGWTDGCVDAGHLEYQFFVASVCRHRLVFLEIPHTMDTLGLGSEHLLDLHEDHPDAVYIRGEGIREAIGLFGGGIEVAARIACRFGEGHFF